MGVRYILADEHTTNIERVLCVYQALVHRRPSGMYIYVFSSAHNFEHVQNHAQSSTHGSEWSQMKNVGAARSMNE